MPARPELLTEVSPPAYHSLGIVTIRSARILAHEDEPRDPVRRPRAGSLTRRCRGVVAGIDLTPTRFRLRRVETAPDGRKVRHLPHHDETGTVDLGHLRAARSRLGQVRWLDPLSEEIARRHLEEHQRELMR